MTNAACSCLSAGVRAKKPEKDGETKARPRNCFSPDIGAFVYVFHLKVYTTALGDHLVSVHQKNLTVRIFFLGQKF